MEGIKRQGNTTDYLAYDNSYREIVSGGESKSKLIIVSFNQSLKLAYVKQDVKKLLKNLLFMKYYIGYSIGYTDLYKCLLFIP